MNRKLNLVKGQKVFVKTEEMSNASRRFKERGGMTLDNVDEWLFEGEVISIGRKYIAVKFQGYEDKFEIESDYRQKYTTGGADYKLYISKQEVLDEKESEELYSHIRNQFGDWNNNHKFALDKLRKIKEIIGNGKGM